MIVIGLDGKEYKLSVKTKPRKNASKLHQRAKALLEELFPGDILYEEVRLTGSRKFNQKDLYADFLLKQRKIIVEVHGAQHYKKTFFHNSKLDFIQAKSRDARKKEWCEINDFLYIELPHGEKDEQWRQRICDGINDRIEDQGV